ncbi:MAG: hypothetical protein JJ869_03555 [Marivita sp.]|uniref:hypothetical protein n=1 Tax=Marivita sp. TaxID=2003365 RepID=UPI001B0DCEB1|nr:hypothetical protein [Marivita sp.]MBO6882643.1 hypothetical protein [Marivita sp.]
MASLNLSFAEQARSELGDGEQDKRTVWIALDTESRDNEVLNFMSTVESLFASIAPPGESASIRRVSTAR